jgi:hypothetical protein
MPEELKIHKLDVVTENGVPFRVVVLVDGKSENFDTASLGKRTLVEFYDRRYNHTSDGQFTGGRYYIDSVIIGGDLTIDHNVEAWYIDSVTFRHIREWLYFLVDREIVRV